ncbi:hypothetical protein [Salipaludibacillus sp. CF4.18]|uniref:hypothetical protein n=1 Tax=Salipaludibacillus sp. CF4.18 TaxID=3373081 RepID=UPI003EE6E356
MKYLKIPLLLIGVLFFAACSENEEPEDLPVNEEAVNDLDTLIATNEQLVGQLEKELKEREQLQERVQELEDENVSLKDDVLTYKQLTIELEENYEKERVLRRQLDEKSREFFQFMHERNHSELENMVADNITVNSESETLELLEDNSISQTFHYLSLEPVIYIRQRTFSYNDDQSEFTTEYEFYTESEESFQFDGGIEIIFKEAEEWKVSSIRYVQ